MRIEVIFLVNLCMTTIFALEYLQGYQRSMDYEEYRDMVREHELFKKQYQEHKEYVTRMKDKGEILSEEEVLRANDIIDQVVNHERECDVVYEIFKDKLKEVDFSENDKKIALHVKAMEEEVRCRCMEYVYTQVPALTRFNYDLPDKLLLCRGSDLKRFWRVQEFIKSGVRVKLYPTDLIAAGAKLINSERYSGDCTLDLDNRGLFSLVGIEEKIGDVRNVSCFNNCIESIPPSLFSKASHITSLCLCSNKLKRVSVETFLNLHLLISLNLSSNKLSVLPEGIFDRLKSLKILSLNNNELVRLPKNLFKYTKKLNTLSIYGNPLVGDIETFDDIPHAKIDVVNDLYISEGWVEERKQFLLAIKQKYSSDEASLGSE